MTTTSNTDRSYEHFIEPKTSGLGNLGTVGTIGMFLGILLGIAIMKTVGVIAGVVFLVLGAVLVAAVAIPDVYRRTRVQRTSTRLAHRLNRANQYVSGPVTRLGSFLLPGILAQTQLSEWTARNDQRYALVYTPATDHYAVTWACHPDGASLTDPAVLAQTVDKWGDYLSFLCMEESAVQVMVTIETSPDYGQGLQRAVHGKAAEDAPPLAAKIAGEIADKYQQGTPSVRSFVTVTFKGSHHTGRRKADQMAADLADRLPELGVKLSASGAGPCRLVDGQTLTEEIRMAYDPACAADVAEARASGNPVVMRWDSIGPPAADKAWDYYRHASGISVTWSMARINGAVNEGSLTQLLGPHAGIAHKRVSLIYSLHDPSKAEQVASADVKSAEFSINTIRGNPTAQHDKRHAAAVANAHHEAHGSGLVDVAVMVTATVNTMEDLPRAVAVVGSLGPNARMLLRRNDGTHAASFAQNLPGIGLITADHSLVPAMLREGL